jgi:hypothetical protein
VTNAYIAELLEVIRHLHGGEATHVESVPVTATYQDRPFWEGADEVFDLRGHPKANRVYAWAHETQPGRPQRHIAVLHFGPITSPRKAVEAAIVAEFRGLDAAEES